MAGDVVDDLRIEIQLPPSEGDNLITNTSGQYGAWQYKQASSSPGVEIIGHPATPSLEFGIPSAGAAGPANIVTDQVPVTPGQYVFARADLVAITSGHKLTLLFQFFDGSGTFISYSSYGSPVSTVGSTATLSGILAPAGAASVLLILLLDHTTDTVPGSGTANAGAHAQVAKVMVTELTTISAPSVIDTNLVPNGGFNSATTGWAPGTNVASLAIATVGSEKYLQANFPSSVTLSDGERSYVNSPLIPIPGPGSYSVRADVRIPGTPAAGVSTTIGCLARFYDASGAQVGSDQHLTNPSTTPDVWRQVWALATAPAGATQARLYPNVQWHGTTTTFSGGLWYVDSVTLVKSDVLQPFWDGDTPDTTTTTYAWTGTANNSASTRTSVGAVAYVEPSQQWTDITFGAVTGKTVRSELDVSTINLSLFDATLSPAIADSVIAPGRGIRVSAWRDETAAYERLFTGTLGPASVAYDPIADEINGSPDISLVGTGAEQLLAQASRTNVSINAAGLAALVLSGAGVPWNVDGSTSITPASSVATNDNATALDQIGLTRDTIGGLAWVRADGVLQVWTVRPSTSVGPNTLGPGDYMGDDLVVSFSTDRVINSVSTTRLIRASDGSTEERQDGPFEDLASVRRWGRQAVTITMASTPSATTDARDRANAILAANANPVIIVEQAKVNSGDVRAHAFHELYDLVTVSASTIDGDVEQACRITSITHEFDSAGRDEGRRGTWVTTLGFMDGDNVAAPAIQPPQASSPTTAVVIGSSQTVGVTGSRSLANTWSQNTGGYNISVGDPIAALGLSYSGGVWTCTVPGVFQFLWNAGMPAIGTSRAILASTLNSTAAPGTTNTLQRIEVASPNIAWTWQLMTTVKLNAGDAIRHWYYQNTGAAITATAAILSINGSAVSDTMTITRLSGV